MPGIDSAYGLPTGTLAGTAFAPELLLPAIRGAVTDDAWRHSVTEALAHTFGSTEMARAAVADWSALTGRVDHQVLELLSGARRHLPVVLVTNATTRLEQDLAALGLEDAVDAVVSSARVGAAKPEPRVYAIAAERAGVAPDRCLFVDDTRANVVAAQALGMTGHHYRDPAGFRAALAGSRRHNG
jgi:putative hydrolase of the HAD superfamily